MDAIDAQHMAAWTVPYLRPYINSVKDFGSYSAIAVLHDGTPRAVVVYNNYSGHDIHMTIASNAAMWATRETLKGFFAYPFKQLGCARVTASTAKHNKKARNLLEKLGFTLEGNLRKGVLGKHDCLYYGMLQEECKWIK